VTTSIPADNRISLRQSIYVRGDVLRRELVCRGVDQQAFARHAGISEATLSHACTGRPVSTTTVRRIVSGLHTLPKLQGAVELVVATPGDAA
jgi:plasmid maintenance system antidote protein VapI